MPISDMDGYENGHFSRVYEHLIKPSCEKAGFTPIRADEVASSNYIVIDILSKIVDSDMVICDLSGRNPNVLYELGIRQAFNLPTVLLKDEQTDKIFDIQGLRYVEYNQALRIDSVEKQIEEVTKSIKETESSTGKDVNSLIQLLGVKSASIPSQIELSGETSVVLSAIKDLSSRMTSLEQSKSLKNRDLRIAKNYSLNAGEVITKLTNDLFIINGHRVKRGQMLYDFGVEMGKLHDVLDDHTILLKNKNGSLIQISTLDLRFNSLEPNP